MTAHCRRFIKRFIHSASAVAVFGALSAQAATLGHSRVASLPDQPLRITVLIKDLSSSEPQSLSAQIAPVSAWQEAGLTPPVALSSLSTHLEPGLNPQRMQLVVQSTETTTASVLDVLVDIKSTSSTQRHQVSVLQAQQATPVALAASKAAPFKAATKTTATASAVTTEKTTTTAVTDSTWQVQSGQHLYAIARQLGHEQYNDQQMMAALVAANPDAFIHGNMNLLRAGATLQIPNVDTVTAVSPQQARQVYQKHLQWFDEYRQRLAKGEAIVPMSNTQPVTAPVASDLSTSTDRLELSAQSEADKKADQALSTAQELAYSAERLAQLEQGSGTSAVADIKNTTLDEQNSVLGDSAENTLAANLAASAAAAQSQSGVDASNTKKTQSTSWLKENSIKMALGFLLLLVIIVTWLLRRVQNSRMEYAEVVPESSDQVREKLNLDLNSPTTDEVEFREIK